MPNLLFNFLLLFQLSKTRGMGIDQFMNGRNTSLLFYYLKFSSTFFFFLANFVIPTF